MGSEIFLTRFCNQVDNLLNFYVTSKFFDPFGSGVPYTVQRQNAYPPIGVTFKFSLLYFKNHIYTTFVIVRLIRYACKRTGY